MTFTLRGRSSGTMHGMHKKSIEKRDDYFYTNDAWEALHGTRARRKEQKEDRDCTDDEDSDRDDDNSDDDDDDDDGKKLTNPSAEAAESTSVQPSGLPSSPLPPPPSPLPPAITPPGTASTSLFLANPIPTPPTVTEFPAPNSFVSEVLLPTAVPSSSVGPLIVPTLLASATFGLSSVTPSASNPGVVEAGSGKTALGATGPTDQPQKEHLSNKMQAAKRTGLIAFGIVLAVLFVVFIAFVLIRRKRKGKRTESHVYSDLETVYRSDIGSAYGGNSGRALSPFNGPTDRPPRLSLRTEEWALPKSPEPAYKQRNFSRLRQDAVLQRNGEPENPFVDPSDPEYVDPGRDLFPLPKEFVRRGVGAKTMVDPFEGFDDYVRARRSSVKEFHSTPSWVVDQTKRIERGR